MNQDHELELPDFKQLDDRHIAPPAKGPIIAIRTNLDEEQSEDEKSRPS